ncbi:hypothetical protein [Nocardia farcinica]|uniref:hypothetical protein n=1 Tax=Nocardia farcinica TaxID=37329 RepID=UPI002457C1A6|nr:hypothetical protein [Nocardia farcinica]
MSYFWSLSSNTDPQNRTTRDGGEGGGARVDQTQVLQGPEFFTGDDAVAVAVELEMAEQVELEMAEQVELEMAD